MSPQREAVVLPSLFLTVTLLAGLQVGSPVTLAPPSTFALVLACLLVGLLIRSGALATGRLLHSTRAPLANANGAVVLATLFAASAQLLTMLTPSSGLPLLLFDSFLLVLFVNSIITAQDRTRALRSLVVILGSAFVLKFVLLASLSSAEGGRLRRALLVMLDVATLGTLSQDPIAPAAGYIAFTAIALFVIAVSALPALARRNDQSLLQEPDPNETPRSRIPDPDPGSRSRIPDTDL